MDRLPLLIQGQGKGSFRVPDGVICRFMSFFSLPAFLSPAECLAIRRGMDAGDAELAEILNAGIHAETDVRAATVIEPAPNLVREVEARLEGCRDAVMAGLGLQVAEREGAGFLRYPAGGFYRAHRDRGDDPEWEGAAHRAVALVVFLNTSRAVSPAGEFDGGVLRLLLPGRDIDLVPEAGLLVAFPADILHEVTEVRGGTRDTVVDWFYDAIRS